MHLERTLVCLHPVVNVAIGAINDLVHFRTPLKSQLSRVFFCDASLVFVLNPSSIWLLGFEMQLHMMFLRVGFAIYHHAHIN